MANGVVSRLQTFSLSTNPIGGRNTPPLSINPLNSSAMTIIDEIHSKSFNKVIAWAKVMPVAKNRPVFVALRSGYDVNQLDAFYASLEFECSDLDGCVMFTDGSWLSYDDERGWVSHNPPSEDNYLPFGLEF